MAGRIRTIKPEILSDAKAARLSDAAWRLWVSSWTLADDEGRLPGDPVWLSGQVFWATARDCQELIGELERAGIVRRYVVNGDPFIEIINWKRHQKINRPSGARYPVPQDDRSGALTEPSLSPHGNLTEGSLPPTIDHRPSTATETSPSRSAVLKAWRKQTGNLVADPSAFSDMLDLVTRAAAEDGRQPEEYVTAFVAWAKSCPPGRRPQMAPHKLVQNFAAVQEWLRGERKPEPDAPSKEPPRRKMQDAEEYAAYLRGLAGKKESA